MTDFDAALALTLGAEGGVSNDPHDRGGLTAYGVTQGAWDAYLARIGQAHRPVTTSTQEERRNLYLEMYWNLGKCDALPWPANAVYFDLCVNSGPGTAAKLLQAVVGARPIDGNVGPVTLGKVRWLEPWALARELVAARRGLYVGLLAAGAAGATSFIVGWQNRMDHIEGVLA